MKELERLFRQSEKAKQLRMLIAYLLNIIIISMFLMISTSIDNVVNEVLDPNQYEQVIAILFSIISISGITIFFFQWVICALFEALYESRRAFNINIRLAGLPKYKLYKLYFAELFTMQLKAVPLGLILSVLLYSMIAMAMNLPKTLLNVKSILLAISLHFLTILFSVTLSLHKANRFSPIELWRGKNRNHNCYQIRVWDWIKAGMGIAILFIASYLNQFFHGLEKILVLVTVILCQNVLFIIVSKALEKVGDLCGIGKLVLSQIINIYSYKRTKVLINMITFSVVMTVGLQAAYLSSRIAAARVSESNIRYSAMITMKEPLLIAPEGKHGYLPLLKFNASSNIFPNIYIQGVNDAFLEKYEIIALNDELAGISTEELKRKIEDENWNGILLPQGQISGKDIGKSFIASINGREIKFVIEGGYFSNNYSELRCLVGNAFLENATGVEGMANTVFVIGNEEIPDLGSNVASVQSKEELVKAGSDKVIRGTELIELAAGIIFLCSLVMLINYAYILSKEKQQDYVKLRAAGVPRNQVLLVFILHFGGMIVFSLLVALPCSGILASAACGEMLAPYYFQDGITYPATVILMELLLLITSPVMMFIASMRKVEKNVYLDLRSMTRE